MNKNRYWLSMSFVMFASTLLGQNTLSIKEALNIAQKNNLRYHAEKSNIEATEAELKTASVRPNPTFNVSWQQIPMMRYAAANSSLFGADNRQLAYQVSQVIPVAHQRKYKIEQAQGNCQIGQLMLDEFQRTLLGEVSMKWLDVWFAEIQLKIIDKAKANSDSLLKINEIRLKNQVITSTEFLRTQIVDQQYGLMLLNALQVLSSEKQNLSLLLGTTDSIRIDENRELVDLLIPLQLDSLLKYAMEKRSDILISKMDIQNANTNFLLQKAISVPQPEVGFSYSTQNKVPYVGAFVAIPIPFFDRNQGEVSKASILIKQSTIMCDATEKAVQTEVLNGYRAFNAGKTTFEKYSELHLKSENVLESVRMSYLKGGTTILDYLEAQKSWFEMETQYYEALFNYRKSFLHLLIATNLISNIQ